MGADGGADAVDQNLAVKMRETLLYQISDKSCISIAGGLGNIAFAAVIATFGNTFFHLIHDCLNDFSLGADLVSGDQSSHIVHIEKGADI